MFKSSMSIQFGRHIFLKGLLHLVQNFKFCLIVSLSLNLPMLKVLDRSLMDSSELKQNNLILGLTPENRLWHSRVE